MTASDFILFKNRSKLAKFFHGEGSYRIEASPLMCTDVYERVNDPN